MAKPLPLFVCQSCGASQPKWSGRCEACGAWNTIVEELRRESTPRGVGVGGRRLDFVGLIGAEPAPLRRRSGIAEFDRVTGGGLVAGSALLVGGDPGIGKSTLLLQVAAALADGSGRCLYISGEESVEQVRLRAQRLCVAERPVELAAATSVRDIVASLEKAGDVALLVADSIQTLFVDSLDSAPARWPRCGPAPPN